MPIDRARTSRGGDLTVPGFWHGQTFGASVFFWAMIQREEQNAPSCDFGYNVSDFRTGEHVDVPSMQFDRGTGYDRDARWL